MSAQLSKSKLKLFSSLAREKKNRDEELLFIAEGERTIHQLLQSINNDGDLIALIHHEKKAPPDFFHQYTEKIYSLTEKDFKTISETEESQGLVGVFRQSVTNQDIFLKTLSEKKSALILILDSIQDPGNVGTIIRTANWFGVSGVIANLQTADFYNPKTVRATAGSLYATPLLRVPILEEFMKELKMLQFSIYSATLNGSGLGEIQPNDRSALILGNEGNGVSEELIKLCDKEIKIDGHRDKVESLNVAVSSGILIQHFCKY